VAGLTGDIIKGFGGNDKIDVTDLAPTAGLTYTAATGRLTAGGLSLSVTGGFSGGQFHLAGDGHGGSFITYS